MRCSRSWARLLKCLINTEICDLKAERIHADKRVRHVVAQAEIDLGDIGFSPALQSRARRIPYLLKTNRRPERRARQFGKAHILNDDVDLVSGGVRKEVLNDATLPVLSDRCVGERRLEKQQRIRIFSLDRRTDSAEVLDNELGKEIAQLRGWRWIWGRAV